MPMRPWLPGVACLPWLLVPGLRFWASAAPSGTATIVPQLDTKREIIVTPPISHENETRTWSRSVGVKPYAP